MRPRTQKYIGGGWACGSCDLATKCAQPSKWFDCRLPCSTLFNILHSVLCLLQVTVWTLQQVVGWLDVPGWHWPEGRRGGGGDICRNQADAGDTHCLGWLCSNAMNVCSLNCVNWTSLARKTNGSFQRVYLRQFPDLFCAVCLVCSGALCCALQVEGSQETSETNERDSKGKQSGEAGGRSLARIFLICWNKEGLHKFTPSLWAAWYIQEAWSHLEPLA